MRSTGVKSLAVGFFDGVHLGHREILRRADAALTFANHPLSVLDPERAPRLIMTAAERFDAIKACGIDDVVMLDFTSETAAMPPEDFVSRYILGSGAGKVFCGEDWRFGRDGAGDASFLRRKGIDVEVVAYRSCRGRRISSSLIRRLLESGDVAEANEMLGRPFRIKGERFRGKGVGSSLGFPTVNIYPRDLELSLPLGVYVVEVFAERAIANYGVSPTMGESSWKTPVLEVHLPKPPEREFSEVDLVGFVRPERKFASAEDLRRQIAADFDKIGI